VEARKSENAVTSVDVARRARVSQATVSRVFSGKSVVRQGTVDRVMTAASELGYRPNAIARSLTSRRTNLIAVVSVDSTHTFYSSILNGISGRLTRAGKQILFFLTDFEAGFDDIFQQVLQYKVDALLIVSAAVSVEITEECSRISLPVVIFNRQIRSSHVFSICSDNRAAARDVADYLAGRGYKAFAYIGSDRRLSDISADRRQGFTERLAELGFGDVRFVCGNYTYESGRTAMRELLDSAGFDAGSRAVFASNDLMAMGAMDAARHEYGLSIPGDIAVVGFDAIGEGAWKSYSLTTVEQPIDKMLDVACSHLMKRLDGKETDGGTRLFRCKILERATA
jgi:LacI family transcriptional regulator